MALLDVPTVTRTVTVSDLTPAEMASIFAGWFDDKQAQFFDALHDESKDWPGCGFAGQAYAFAQKLTPKGRKIMDDIIDNCGAA